MNDIKKSILVLHLPIQKLLKAPEEPIYCYMKEYNYTLRLQYIPLSLINTYQSSIISF